MKGIIAAIIASFQIAIMFIIILIFYGTLIDSPLGQNPQTQAVLESGQEATVNAFNWWLIINFIGGLILIVGIIFGIIYAAIKIAGRESSRGV